MREGDIHSALPVRAASSKLAPCRQHGPCLHSSPTKPPLSPSGQPQDADRQSAAQHPTTCVSLVSNCFATAVAPCICSAGKQKCSDSPCSHLQATHWCDTKEDQTRDGVLVLIKIFVIPVITQVFQNIYKVLIPTQDVYSTFPTTLSTVSANTIFQRL